ncbi:MAG: hypothetical protein ACAH83_09095 [Alphaproteobacteria bacterium]
MSGNAPKDIIDESRERQWTAEQKIIKHFGGSVHDRYAGEFPYPDKKTGAPQLTECFAFGDKSVRDAIANAFEYNIQKSGWPDITVKKEDQEGKNGPWPYDLDITVAGPNIHSTLEAYPKMADYFTAVAAALPQRPGTPWAEYIKDKEVYPGGQLAKVNAMLELYPDIEAYVVGTHTSKSRSLPVVQIEFPRRGTLLTFRDNFHDICVSVDSRFPIARSNMEGLFRTNDKGGFFEGFPQNLVHEPYDKDQKQFSFCIGDYPSLAMILGEVSHQDWVGPPGDRPDPTGKSSDEIRVMSPIRFKR